MFFMKFINMEESAIWIRPMKPKRISEISVEGFV